MNTIKTYYLVTKPGIIMGNLITNIAGFALASKAGFNPLLFLITFLGLGLVIGSACVFNNYIDLEADQKMSRTKNRPLAAQLISGKAALVFASFLGALGFLILSIYTNRLAVFVAGIGFFIYVVLYSFWKYQSRLAILVGSVAGAIPPVVGYCAAGGVFDLGAAFLFLILFAWQMPHFFAIAIYRMQDYKSAGIPVFPLEKGMFATKLQSVYYIIAFFISVLALYFFDFAGVLSTSVGGILGLVWLFLAIRGFWQTDHIAWARQMFRFSLITITLLSIVLSCEGIL
jgi:protoheme IX farnesyltransferase